MLELEGDAAHWVLGPLHLYVRSGLAEVASDQPRHVAARIAYLAFVSVYHAARALVRDVHWYPASALGHAVVAAPQLEKDCCSLRACFADVGWAVRCQHMQSREAAVNSSRLAVAACY